ncbi:hypothetical protein [Streptomyces sp. KL116D]|uniref:hypothetical protein n=1 Tax=Streptomyces sp. KL116D TaxID=3045152 RepID=UPI0035572D54
MGRRHYDNYQLAASEYVDLKRLEETAEAMGDSTAAKGYAAEAKEYVRASYGSYYHGDED